MPGEHTRFQRTPEGQAKIDEVIRRRIQGQTFDKIAREMGYADMTGPYHAYKRAMDAIPKNSIAELRDKMEYQLEVLLEGLFEKAEKGDTWAVDRALAIFDRLAKLRGLDAPSRKHVEVVTQDKVDSEIARLEEELATR